MLITLSRRTAICQSVAEVQLTGVAPLGAVSHRFIIIFIIAFGKHAAFDPLSKLTSTRLQVITTLQKEEISKSNVVIFSTLWQSVSVRDTLKNNLRCSKRGCYNPANGCSYGVYIIRYGLVLGGSPQIYRHAMIVLKQRMLSILPRIRIKSPKLWLLMFYRMPYTLILFCSLLHLSLSSLPVTRTA